MHFSPTVTTRASQPSDGDLLEEKAIPEVGRSNEWVSPHLTPHSLPGMLRWRKVAFLLPELRVVLTLGITAWTRLIRVLQSQQKGRGMGSCCSERS